MMVMNIRRAVDRFIYSIGILAIVMVLYVCLFYLIAGVFVHPYERDNMGDTHWSRPTYNVIFYPMRWFVANKHSFNLEQIDVFYGYLRKPVTTRDDPRMRSLTLIGLDDIHTGIGFTGDNATLEAVDQLEAGSYLKIVYGRALPNDRDRFINRLISYEVIDLMEDPRIPDEKMSREEEEAIMDAYGKLVKNQSDQCVKEYLNNYRDKVLEHCLQAGYAQNIGGGCYHVVGYSISNTIISRALKSCGDQGQ